MPIYGISDLHMGDGGPRDNFAYGGHEKDLLSFLDMVQDTHGQLVIAGDLFELWQSNVSRALTKRIWLLDRLAQMEAIYVLGNHDADLKYFIDEDWLFAAHPFFRRMCRGCYKSLGGRKFVFIHGHAADPYCADDRPGLGRITAIYTGLREDQNGSPLIDKYQTVEAKSLGWMEGLASAWNWLRGKPERFTEINRNLYDLYLKAECDVFIAGHTHKAGKIGTWLYNCGTWAEGSNSFVRINDNGTVGVFDWHNGSETRNNTELPI